MTKKKRSAKQLANDRRLGRMAKARAKKKRKKTPTRRRKVARKNPHRKIRTPGAKRRIRAPAVKRKVSAKSHLWFVFGCLGSRVVFLHLGSFMKFNWTSDKGKTLFFKTKGAAGMAARSISKKRGMSKYQIGIASDDMTTTQIAAHCTEGKV